MDQLPDTDLIERIARRHIPPCFTVVRSFLSANSPNSGNPAPFSVTVEIRRINDGRDPGGWFNSLATEVRAGWDGSEFSLLISDLGSEFEDPDLP